jgi:hypothetical protein
MLESINDTRFSGIVRRHLHFYSIANRQSNKTFAHFAGDMGENEMLISERDPKHRPWEHRHYGALQFDRFCRAHTCGVANSAALV